MTRLRLGTRGSQLALVQSHMVAGLLETRHAGLSVEIVEFRTSGDRMPDVPLGPGLGDSFFTKEIESALLDGRVDLAVHSCKDLAAVLPQGLRLGAVPFREDPRDALVSLSGTLTELPAAARVGTSSMRRRRFLSAFRPDLSLVELRGNVPARVRAVDEGRCDAVVLAVAGLRRLGLEGRITEVLDLAVMIPAAAQGALALEVREDDEATRAMVAVLDDAASHAEVTAERACLRRLGAGCYAPVAALGRAKDENLELRAAVVGSEGIVSVHRSSRVRRADELGVRAAEDLLSRLGLATLRGVPWAGVAPGRTEDV
ncbi:MAG TPA: hydroxymethylbilane synthase [Longimicrobiales bacterium]|nr:hydroxymethylbilane synthase [Longimicrobiales bacterium]